MRIKSEQGSIWTPRGDVQAMQAINYPRPFIDCQMSLRAWKVPCEKPVFIGSQVHRDWLNIAGCANRLHTPKHSRWMKLRFHRPLGQLAL